MPPHARAMDARDLALFGGLFPPKALCSGRKQSENAELSGIRIAWKESNGAHPVALARRISDRFTSFAETSGLDVPAPTYIAGECTSSFALAWSLLEQGRLPEWSAVLCSCQTEGRGQLRRNWHSPRGNLYVSFRLPDDPVLQGDAASLSTGRLLAGAFARLGFSLSLKWPNDLLSNAGAKVGGVLLEEKDGVLLAGLGVNLVESPPAASLRQEGATCAGLLPLRAGEKIPPSPFLLWRHLVSALILEYSSSVAGRGLARVLTDLEPFLAWKGRDVVLTEYGGPSFTGRYQGLGERGGLIIRQSDGESREFFSGSLALAESAAEA